MISDKRMKLVSSRDGMDYYMYKPSLLHMYYDDSKQAQWPSHQNALSHKLHLLIYLLFGEYRILYMLRGDDVVSYVVFSRGGRVVIRGTSKEDIYTIFVWTYPEYRRRGYGEKLVSELLHGAGVRYRNSYKTIVSDNIPSIKTAQANGYRRLYPVKRTKLLHTAYRCDDIDNYHLYIFERAE